MSKCDDPAKGDSAGKGCLVNLFLLFLSLTVCLLVSEAIVRYLRLAPQIAAFHRGSFQLSDNLEIGFSRIPNFEWQGEDLSWIDFRGRINVHGFRGKDYSQQKQEGIFRIVVLGDSVAEGWGVNDDDLVWPAVLHQHLQTRNAPAEVLNLAVASYNTNQEVALLEDKGLSLLPDLVIVGYCLNDTEQLNMQLLSGIAEQANKPENRLISGKLTALMLQSSALLRLAWYLTAGSASVQVDVEKYKAFQKANLPKALNRLRDLSIANGFAVLIVIFPRMDLLFSEGYPHFRKHDFIRNAAVQRGFEMLELVPVMTACEKNSDSPLGLDKFHLSPAGHRCAAEGIARYLRETRPELFARPR